MLLQMLLQYAWIEAMLQEGVLPKPCSSKYPNRCLSQDLLAAAKEHDRYTNESKVAKKLQAILQARQRRLFAAAEAKAAGYGGIAAVSRVTRIAASTIGRGLKDIEALDSLAPGRVRRPGGGRKSLTETDPQLQLNRMLPLSVV
jgi:DNA-binding phage protein